LEQPVTTQRNAIIRRFLPVLVVATLAAAAPSVWSQPTDTSAPAAQDNASARQARIQQHLQARLQRMAEHLQITPAQQTAWTMYATSVQSLIGANPARPAPEADAASIARFRAELAAERAQKLSQLADATATLQQALDPQQQKTLDEIVRHAGRRAHYRHGL
jgi:protein CpxP